MLALRPAHERGYADHGWLRSYHSFSFAGYVDPAHMGWGNLRVINEDWIAPGRGFGMHPHRDMEILTYVMAGALAHRDSMGNAAAIPAHDVQRMSAGTGVLHSEFNPAPDETTHLLQIWVHPAQAGRAPGYEQRAVGPRAKAGRLVLLAAPEGSAPEAAVHWGADACLYAGVFDGLDATSVALDSRRKAYVHVARGALHVNGLALQAGDALRVADEAQLNFSNAQDAEVLLFDLCA